MTENCGLSYAVGHAENTVNGWLSKCGYCDSSSAFEGSFSEYVDEASQKKTVWPSGCSSDHGRLSFLFRLSFHPW